MTIRAIFVAITIWGAATLTGCASKQAVNIDPGTQPATLPAPTAPPAAITKKSEDGIVTGSTIAEIIPMPEDAPAQTPNPRTELHLDPVYFDFDSYLLRADARDTLTRNARGLTENGLARVIIEGHADERGSDEYNLALAEKRAIAAKRYIETLGINPDRLETISYGENKPAAIGHDEATWARNRRVEFVIAK